MPKSKRSIKRRKKVKNKPNYNQIHKEDNSFESGYTKTDGQSRVCKYDKNHNFLGYLTEEAVTEPYINNEYYCKTCNNIGKSDPITSYCFECGDDNWQPVDF